MYLHADDPTAGLSPEEVSLALCLARDPAAILPLVDALPDPRATEVLKLVAPALVRCWRARMGLDVEGPTI